MPRPRPFALSFALPLVFALDALPVHAGDPAASTESAMHCVQARMADPLLPVTANAEQIAQVALARCADEIETAAADLAASQAATQTHGTGSGRIEAARIAVRRLLLDYALDAAAGAAAIASTSLDAGIRSLD